MSALEEVDEMLAAMLETHGNRDLFNNRSKEAIHFRSVTRMNARAAMRSFIEEFGHPKENDPNAQGYLALRDMMDAHFDEVACTNDSAAAASIRGLARRKARVYLKARKEKEFAKMENFGAWA